MSTPASRFPIRAGFIPLIDAAMLIVARDRGFAAKEGIDLILQKEASWASIRDKTAVGHLEAAHMLAPLPIAVNLGLGPVKSSLIAPMALGVGGNSIVTSAGLALELQSHGVINPDAPASSALLLRHTVADRARSGAPRLTFAVVHQFSSHFFELAYWMASAGLAPYRDVDLIVLPPMLMADALAAGQIDGFCAGEPWGSVAVARYNGVILAQRGSIHRAGPEKVLGLRTGWATREPSALEALLRALHHAAVWCDENRQELVAVLSQPHYLDLPKSLLAPVLDAPGSAAIGKPFTFSSGAATFPWTSHALWFYSQMVRWGQTPPAESSMSVAQRTYRPDLYRSALSPLGVAIPAANAKLEGTLQTVTPVGTTTGRLSLGPDQFFDGKVFDPDRVADYIDGFTVHTRTSVPN